LESGEVRVKIDEHKVKQLEQFATEILSSNKATLRVHEAAAIARCHDKIIRKYVAAGVLPRLELTRTILIPRAAFMAWLESGGRPKN
jgi:excisionase family DNA binding protein